MYRKGEIHFSEDTPFGVRDGLILEHYGVNELHFDSVKSYRNRFMAVKPNHPWNGLETKEFLYKIGAWGKLRDSGREGLTLAGLLMFSEERVITEVLPHYFLEYRDDTHTFGDERWSDRVTSQDGTWTGNLHDFYFMVMPRLTSGLQVPFQLQGTVRHDETAVHTALREALVNAIVHADYEGERGIVVERERTSFAFSNPGLLRVPISQALEGGVSDLRNPNLCKMFLLIGLGERAGSGLFNIRQTWRDREWEIPQFLQQETPARTTFILRMISVDTQENEEKFRTIGDSYNKKHGSVNKESDSDNINFKSLNNVLSSFNKENKSLNNEFISYNKEDNSGNKKGNFYNNEMKSLNNVDLADSTDGETDLEEKEGLEGGEGTEEELWRISELARKRKRLSPKVMEEIIVRLCVHRPLRLKELADMLERTPDGLRNNYLAKLLREGRIRLKYPDQVNHPKQAYITVR
ncbi:transcriptional regulator [Aneurinibacillus migulanus]|uniref:ATP-binding protein n=1 Tax=Aneurinibacillus migulanus TaxID=47500 RepID=UPI002E1E2CF7|nr:transcriptional regulator [Aneurinibacillus migulanus]